MDTKTERRDGKAFPRFALIGGSLHWLLNLQHIFLFCYIKILDVDVNFELYPRCQLKTFDELK